MAAIKTSNTSNAKPGVQYHVADAHGNHVVAELAPASISPVGVPTLRIGGTPSNAVYLTQQNAADLAAVISNFGSTGTIT